MLRIAALSCCRKASIGNIISFTPPLTITQAQLKKTVAALRDLVQPSPLTMKLSEIKQILTERDLQLTKSLGQNFLHDQNQLRRIVDAAELRASDKVLEIGPGLGPLTELLVAQAGEVLAIEKDERLFDYFAREICRRLQFKTPSRRRPGLR